jgi:hypothetical protein
MQAIADAINEYAHHAPNESSADMGTKIKRK